MKGSFCLYFSVCFVFVGALERKVVSVSLDAHSYIEGSRPECCISSMIYSRDTLLWSGTLDMIVYLYDT